VYVGLPSSSSLGRKLPHTSAPWETFFLTYRPELNEGSHDNRKNDDSGSTHGALVVGKTIAKESLLVGCGSGSKGLTMRKLIPSAVVIWLLYIATGTTAPQSPAGSADSRTQFPPSAAQVHGRRVPKLSTLRSGSFETPPIPGGIGAGTLYRQGSLQVLLGCSTGRVCLSIRVRMGALKRAGNGPGI
jgi:hypothetical protein